MSKFLCLGMELIDVIQASTAAPAAALGRTNIGSLPIGGVGDATVLEQQAMVIQEPIDGEAAGDPWLAQVAPLGRVKADSPGDVNGVYSQPRSSRHAEFSFQRELPHTNEAAGEISSKAWADELALRL
jgi:hypothetical protein